MLTPTKTTIEITNRAALTAGGALAAAMKPREGCTPLPPKVIWAMTVNQQKLADVAEQYSKAQQQLQIEHTRMEDGKPVRETQTEREITGEGATRKEMVREVPTGETILIDPAAYGKAVSELGEMMVEVTMRQVPLSVVLEAGWEQGGLWPLVDIVLVEDEI